jgi:class 3 adenylate cyclase/pimeloyl-ACP methyl ester carboxylesterase
MVSLSYHERGHNTTRRCGPLTRTRLRFFRRSAIVGMMNREIRYCTTEDGVRIAYSIEGDGYPLLWCPAFVESFSHTDGVPAYETLMAELAARWTLIRYDPRGIGLSEHEGSDQSNAALARDIEAVVAAAGLERTAVWGNTMSGPRAITLAVERPGLVTHLVLYDSFADPFKAFPQAAAHALAELARSNWPLAADTISDMGMRDPEVSRRAPVDYFQSIARLYERSCSGDVAASLMSEVYESWDVRRILAEVRCPTLIIHHLDNPIIAIEAGKELAAGIREARFAAVEGAWQTPSTDLALGSDPVLRVEGLLPVEAPVSGAAPPQPRAPAVTPAVHTILFTDVEGSTALTQRLGDAKAREILREHERITREALAAHGGAEVKTMGDGFMTSFTSATAAIECAIAIQKAFDNWNADVGVTGQSPINVRIGLNAGEPIAEEEDLFGTAVNMAARICAKAEGGQILAPVVVRELVAGKGFLLSDIGETALRGFEDPVRLYEVRWREEHR